VKVRVAYRVCVRQASNASWLMKHPVGLEVRQDRTSNDVELLPTAAEAGQVQLMAYLYEHDIVGGFEKAM
jgi:hypothetical protein